MDLATGILKSNKLAVIGWLEATFTPQKTNIAEATTDWRRGEAAYKLFWGEVVKLKKTELWPFLKSTVDYYLDEWMREVPMRLAPEKWLDQASAALYGSIRLYEAHPAAQRYKERYND